MSGLNPLPELVSSHVSRMGWGSRKCYAWDRGWKTAPSELGNLTSPHDGLEYSPGDAVFIEMMLELEGRPTQRSGEFADTKRGEAWVDGVLVSPK